VAHLARDQSTSQQRSHQHRAGLGGRRRDQPGVPGQAGQRDHPGGAGPVPVQRGRRAAAAAADGGDLHRADPGEHLPRAGDAGADDGRGQLHRAGHHHQHHRQHPPRRRPAADLQVEAARRQHRPQQRRQRDQDRAAPGPATGRHGHRERDHQGPHPERRDRRPRGLPADLGPVQPDHRHLPVGGGRWGRRAGPEGRGGGAHLQRARAGEVLPVRRQEHRVRDGGAGQPALREPGLELRPDRQPQPRALDVRADDLQLAGHLGLVDGLRLVAVGRQRDAAGHTPAVPPARPDLADHGPADRRRRHHPHLHPQQARLDRPCRLGLRPSLRGCTCICSRPPPAMPPGRGR
jgi:hypothetical protein